MKLALQQGFVRYWLLLLSGMGSWVGAADVVVNVNAASPIRTIPMTLYGANLASWDGSMGGSNTAFNNLMKASGCKYFRIPGGSWSNGHLWSDIEELYSPYGSSTWKVSYNEYLYLMSQLSQPGQEVAPTLQPIVNFPGGWYGYTDENGDYITILHGHQAAVDAAVAWVQDQTARATCAQYWEIGNEIGGPWEVGWFDGISGTYYGDYFADFYLGMKAVNPNIKIGACAEPKHELQPWGWYDGYWTYDTLQAAAAKNAVPDFLIIHSYQNGGGNGDASNNPNLLGSQINDIAQWTSNLDSIIQNAIGAHYVGQIEYCMTEWNTSAYDPDGNSGTANDYDRPRCYINAMFRTQYILEMAKHNWTVSNPWIYDYGSNYWVFPVWYVKPLLINRFGREMIEAEDTHAMVRSYAAVDAAGNLTVLMVNNSPTADLTADINIIGFQAAASGLRWLVEPAGTIIANGINLQDKDNISINGIVHPDPLTVKTLAGVEFTAANTMTLTLPKSSMLFLTIPENSEVDPDTIPPSPDPMRWMVRPYVSKTGSIAMEAAAASDLNGVQYYFTCTSGGGHDSGWQTSPVYEDSGLTAGSTYTYTVKARDLAAERNETSPSPAASAVMISPLTSTLNLINPSFENGKTGWSFDPDGKFYTDSSQSTDGDWALHAGWYTGYTEIYFLSEGIWQDTDYTIQSNELFVLKFDYWSENGWGAHEVNADISYYNPNNSADTGLIATMKFQTGGATYQWMTFTLNADVNTVPAAVGKKLRIRFRPMGYYWSYYKFDNIRLYQSVYNPQPAMWANSVGLDGAFSWTPAVTDWQTKGWTFDVYLSTDSDKVTTLNPEARAASGLPQILYNSSGLTGNTGCFWRVVANEPKTGGVIIRHPGPVWYFTTQYQWRYGDFTENGVVDFDDLGGFLLLWLDSDCTAISDYDLNGDCVINLYEFSEIARNWQKL
jgi:hypothetical protein